MPGQAPSDRRDDTAVGDLPTNLRSCIRPLRAEDVFQASGSEDLDEAFR
jgi:hypothetical protein